MTYRKPGLLCMAGLLCKKQIMILNAQKWSKQMFSATMWNYFIK